MGWSSPTPWSTPRELPEEEFLDRLSALLCGCPRPAQDRADDPRPAVRLGTRHGAAAVARPAPDGVGRRPAAGTGRLDRRSTAIETFKPVLGVHGHIHESGGERRIGDDASASMPGPRRTTGILRGFLVDLTADGVERTLRVEG